MPQKTLKPPGPIWLQCKIPSCVCCRTCASRGLGMRHRTVPFTLQGTISEDSATRASPEGRRPSSTCCWMCTLQRQNSAPQLICLDEPEIHLNPAVQASVLTEIMRLLPDGSQLWIATHSVGMIRRAFDITADEPGRVAFLNFGQVEGPAPDVRLKPSQPSSKLLHEAMSVALDDLARLLAPEVLVICEGSQISDRIHVWDERIYRQIFRDLHPRVEFKSSGGKGELERAAAIASVIAPGTSILKLRDRDDLTPENRARLLEGDSNLRVLQRRSLESYLLDDEVLEALVCDRGAEYRTHSVN